MKAVILAGGLGTRISEETETKPKPMVNIGDRPILWHILKIYSYYGINDFIIALGYKGNIIKQYFLDYYSLMGDFEINLGNGNIHELEKQGENWNIQLIETGNNTSTGGRIKRLKKLLNDEPFLLTYGDGVSNINIKQLIDFHNSHECLATITAVRPPARYGAIVFNENQITSFEEKPQASAGWINGGYMVLDPDVLDYIDGDETSFEMDTLRRLAADNQLMAYKHFGFWQCMDTLRDKRVLEQMWAENTAEWKIWE